MDGDADIAAVATLAADQTRACILLALADGRMLPATDLSDAAGVSPSTASAHLRRLLDGGLLRVEQHGRHRYYGLAGAEVARLIEALARIAPAAPVRSLRSAQRAGALRHARTCYDHLAGVLGTELMAALLERKLIVEHGLTDRGERELERFGIELERLPKRRPLIRYCLDWSERRHHLAGALGAAIATRMFELGWITRGRSSRAVIVSETGREGLRKSFGVILA